MRIYRLDGIVIVMNDPQPEAGGPSVRDRLLDSAERVVARDGVSRLTLAAVAHQAGVSKGGLLYHFPTKSALVTAIVRRLAERCEADQRRAVSNDRCVSGAFTRAYLAVRAQALAEQDQLVQAALLAAAGTNPRYLDPFRERLIEWQARLEADGIDAATASIVRLAIDGLCLGRLLGVPVPEGDLQRRVLERLVNMTVRDNRDG